MAKARIYLFHGNDSRASSLELRRWLDVFVSKYGETTQYILYADELAFEELLQKLSQALETQSLFPEPRFIVVKRLASSAPVARVREALKVVGSRLSGLDEHVTLVFWEDRFFANSHALPGWFVEHVNRKQAEVKTYQAGTARALVDSLQARKQISIDSSVASWLENQARRMEREQRVAAKLRSGDEIPSDWRVWILEQVLESALLLAGNDALEVGHLEAALGVTKEAISPFEIVNAVQAENWRQARKLVRAWDQGDEGAYFGLVALLRNHFRRAGSGREGLYAYALELLAEIEILSKNVTVRQSWLLDLFLIRCEQFSDKRAPLVAPRRLWLSHVQRVE